MLTALPGGGLRYMAFLLGVLVAPLWFPSPACAQRGDFPELTKRFAPADQPASYVIVIDMSGSMTEKGYFPIVRRAVCDFVNALPNGDYLSLLGFNLTARRLVIPQRLEADRREIIGLVEETKDPRPERRTDPENFTDIGKALKETVRELRAPGSPRVQFVFFLTDGVHEPGASSEFPRKTGPAWDSLRQTADQALRSKLLQVTALALGSETDIDLVQSIFPEATPIVVDRRSLRPFFERMKAEMQRDRLELLVAGDLRRRPLDEVRTTRFSLRNGGTAQLSLSIPRSFERLDGVASVRILSSTGCEVTGPQTRLRIPSSLDFVVRAPGRDRFWTVQKRTPSSFGVRVDVTAEPEAEIRRLGLNPQSSRELLVEGEVLSGRPLTLLAVIAFGILLALGLTVRQLLCASLPAFMMGRLVCIDGPAPRPGDVILRGYRRLTIGGGQEDSVRLDGEDERALATLVAKREPPSWWRRLGSWSVRSSTWLSHAGCVILTQPAREERRAEDVLSGASSAGTEPDLLSASEVKKEPERGPAKPAEREGVIASQRLTNGAQMIIGAYTFRWDEYYDPKEAPGGERSTG
jgi:hypothetical protein